MIENDCSTTLTPDIAILGGGIAGLWLLNRLQRQGYQCVLLETDTLGGGQTLASQGIIHGGLKYALGGTLSSESEAIAGMPDRWRAAIAGHGEVDLAGLRVLSASQQLWSAGSVASRMTTFFASKMLRGRIERLNRADFPSALASRRFKGQVYRLDDLVVDTESLLDVLTAPVRHRLLKFDPRHDERTWNDAGLQSFRIGNTRFEPRLTILAAGNGNAALLAEAQRAQLLPREASQERPLRMVLLKHNLGHRLYAHCIGTGSKPRLTVTSHALADGEIVWYLGGDLAEKGVGHSDAEQLDAARAELNTLFPWLDFRDARLALLDVSRAEPRQQGLAKPGFIKPDNAYAHRDRNLIITWPTKLTLAPDLGDRVQALINEQGLKPGPALTLPALPQAPLGRPHWHSLFANDGGVPFA